MRGEVSRLVPCTVDLASSEPKTTKDSKPPLPKVHSTPKKTSTPKATEMRKPTEKLVKNAKASPRITPKATPLQSPGAENAPLIRGSTGEIIKSEVKEDAKSEDKHQEEKKDQGTEKTQVINSPFRPLKRMKRCSARKNRWSMRYTCVCFFFLINRSRK